MRVAVDIISVDSFFQFSKMRRNRSQRKVKQDLEKKKKSYSVNCGFGLQHPTQPAHSFRASKCSPRDASLLFMILVA